jgi:hypothetical protein
MAEKKADFKVSDEEFDAFVKYHLQVWEKGDCCAILPTCCICKKNG